MAVGAILFIAAGSLAIAHHDPLVGGARRDTGLAMGSIAIADGVVFLIDAALLAKGLIKK